MVFHGVWNGKVSHLVGPSHQSTTYLRKPGVVGKGPRPSTDSDTGADYRAYDGSQS